jgi:Uma2 family endonuclease
MTLDEYLTYDDGTDTCYELVDGVLVTMGAESTGNTWIALFFIELFLRILPRQRIGIKQKTAVQSPTVTAREPDLIIHSAASAGAIAGRSESCLRLEDPNPALVIEVVSPGDEASDNYQRDYVQKSQDYAARGISEYWIVDPEWALVRVGALAGGTYQFQDFAGNQPMVSPTFPELTLTAEQVVQAGR